MALEDKLSTKWAIRKIYSEVKSMYSVLRIEYMTGKDCGISQEVEGRRLKKETLSN